MKFRIEIDENQIEPEIIVKCKVLSEEIIALQKALGNVNSQGQELVLFKDDTEFFMPADDVIFFETDGRLVNVHTVDNVYQTKLKLYGIEEMFPNKFMRVSKSALVNIKKIFSLTRGISGSYASFQGTVKTLYISRMYYKDLKEKLEESRLLGRE